MPYVTLQQLLVQPGEPLLIQLTDRSVPATGAVDEAVVSRVLADSDALINGYLAGRYSLPLESTPPLVASLAQAIVFYRLHNFAPEAKVQKDYDDAISTLKQIASGTVKLDVAGVEPISSGASGVIATDRERDMTPDSLRGFI